MLALEVNVLVLGHVAGEGVDGAAVVDHDEEKREALLGRDVEGLGHASVLGAALADEDDRDAIVVGVLLRVVLAVHQDRTRRTCSVGQLLGNERPATLHVGRLVEDVHRSARALARATDLAEELSHDSTGVNARGQSVRVLAVVRVLLVAHLDSVRDKRRDGLLAVVQMHESADVTLHVLLVARRLELARELHHGVGLDEVLLLNVLVLVSLLGG
mmetsp:Transcript_25246/g.59905  ORF Transcript_25246/g.59905 Transcript_25246/m.59905 type:complete len:215 (-) Transcript_25246:297-941(-)